MEDEAGRALEEIRKRIAGACARSGRDPGSVAIVAVSKTFPAERVREMLAHGQHVFGENRVQEALEKIPLVGPGASWHLVGHLQGNKAKRAVGTFDLIHSVDGSDLAREIDRRAAARGIVQAVLVQVNLSREATKSGVAEEGTAALLETGAEEARPWFAGLRNLRDRAEPLLGRKLKELSMGMTDDFEVAIEEGATLVRVGRALFGER